MTFPLQIQTKNKTQRGGHGDKQPVRWEKVRPQEPSLILSQRHLNSAAAQFVDLRGVDLHPSVRPPPSPLREVRLCLPASSAQRSPWTCALVSASAHDERPCAGVLLPVSKSLCAAANNGRSWRFVPMTSHSICGAQDLCLETQSFSLSRKWQKPVGANTTLTNNRQR